MALAQQAPKLPANPEPPKRYAWEDEETLVQKRNRLPNRIGRFFGNNWFKLILIMVLLFILLDAATARTMVAMVERFGQSILRLFITAFVVLGQFGLMFWFLGRARMYTIWPGTEGVSFKDYRGQPELLDQAKQIVKLLRGVRVFEEAGGEPLNGLMLEGPPGTGKTWLAQAISTEAGVPFFYVDASSMNSMFIGIAPLKVANLYRRARKAAKQFGASVIFIDEIDAIGSRSGVATPERELWTTGMGEDAERAAAERIGKWRKLPIFFGGGNAQNGLLSTLLIEMSGFSLEHGWAARQKRAFYKTFLRRNPPKVNKRILTIGATNRIGALDPALLRPGRFDKKIRVDAPDMEGRRDIIAYYMSKMSHDDTVDPLIVASETPFYTPADLKYLLNEALRYALFDNRTVMTVDDIRRAQPEHEFGLRTPIKNLAAEDKYRLCAHEAGHAVAIRLYMPNYRISRITVIRQGQAHGYVQSYPAQEEDQYMALGTYEQLMNRLRVSVAGKAGEMEYVGVGAQTLGVGGDFQNIRAILYMLANSGMFGPLGAALEGTNYPAEMREAMEDAFRMALDDVRMMLRLHREMGEALINQLMEKDELLANEVEAFFDTYGFMTPKVKLYQSEPQAEIVTLPAEQDLTPAPAP